MFRAHDTKVTDPTSKQDKAKWVDASVDLYRFKHKRSLSSLGNSETRQI